MFADALAASARAPACTSASSYDWLRIVADAPLTARDARRRRPGARYSIHCGSTVRSAEFTRDHRKTIVVDGKTGFVSGLCVSTRWERRSQARAGAVARYGHRIAAARAWPRLERAFAQVCGTFAASALPAAGI